MYKLYNEDLRFFSNKKFLHFDLEYLYFVSNSVKCIICRMTYNIRTYTRIVCTKWIIGSVPLQ